MSDGLRERLLAAKLAGTTAPMAGDKWTYRFRSNEQAAVAAVDVFAAWLREVAEMRDASWVPYDPYALDDHYLVAGRVLDALADTIQPEETRTDG